MNFFLTRGLLSLELLILGLNKNKIWKIATSKEQLYEWVPGKQFNARTQVEDFTI